MIDAETYRHYGRTVGGIEFRTLPPANPNAEVDGDRGAYGGVGGRDEFRWSPVSVRAEVGRRPRWESLG